MVFKLKNNLGSKCMFKFPLMDKSLWAWTAEIVIIGFQQLSTALSRAMDGYGQLFVVALDHGLRVAWWTVFLDSENILILVQDASKSQN